MKARHLFLLLLSFVVTTGLALAQTEPPRGGDREAPDREATVLSRETREPGVVNVTIAIPAEADSYIASARPNRNFGNGALYLGYNNVGDQFGAQRSLLRFNVDGNLPAGAVVDEARLQLRLYFASPADDDAMPTVLRALIEGWEEDTVTWNNQPAWGDVYDETDVGTAYTWYEWEITELVQEWEEDSLANNGVEIIGDEAIQQRERAFYAR